MIQAFSIPTSISDHHCDFPSIITSSFLSTLQFCPLSRNKILSFIAWYNKMANGIIENYFNKRKFGKNISYNGVIKAIVRAFIELFVTSCVFFISIFVYWVSFASISLYYLICYASDCQYCEIWSCHVITFIAAHPKNPRICRAGMILLVSLPRDTRVFSPKTYVHMSFSNFSLF